MTRFADWCTEITVACASPHTHRMLTADSQKVGDAVEIIAGIIPDHYAESDRLSDIFSRLGRPGVAKYIDTKMPLSLQTRSGDLGEVLSTTYVHERSPFKRGIKRLRWKDHRNLAMRGDDVLGFKIDAGTGRLTVLKAESKSAVKLSKTTVDQARTGLSNFGELPSPHALVFVSDLLTDPNDLDLKNALDDLLVKPLTPADVTHLLFVLTGNDSTKLLQNNLSSYTGACTQIYVGVRIHQHQEFIDAVFSVVAK